MTVAKADIEDKVRNRFPSIPSAVSDAMINEWIEDAHIKIENLTGQSFATSDIPTRFQSLITDMAAVMLLDYMIRKPMSVAGDFNLSYSELRETRKELQMRIDQELNYIGRRRVVADYTEPND